MPFLPSSGPPFPPLQFYEKLWSGPFPSFQASFGPRVYDLTLVLSHLALSFSGCVCDKGLICPDGPGQRGGRRELHSAGPPAAGAHVGVGLGAGGPSSLGEAGWSPCAGCHRKWKVQAED